MEVGKENDSLFKDNFIFKISVFVIVIVISSLCFSSIGIKNNKLLGIIFLFLGLFFSCITDGYIVEALHYKLNSAKCALPKWNSNLFSYAKKGFLFSLIGIIYVSFFILLTSPFIIIFHSASILYYFTAIFLLPLLLSAWISYSKNYNFKEGFNLSQLFKIYSKKRRPLLLYSGVMCIVIVISKFIFPLSNAYPNLLNYGKFLNSFINGFFQNFITSFLTLMIGKFVAESCSKADIFTE